MKSSLLLPALTAAALLVACVPKVENAPTKAATRYCHRAEECNNLQEGEFDDCVDSTEDAFQLLWDQDRCNDNGFQRAQWSECWDALDSWDCEALLAGWDVIGSRCAAAEVCPL